MPSQSNKLWSGVPKKNLTQGKNMKGGRNNLGRITIKGRKKGAKKSYRKIDFARNNEFLACINRIEYDPNRSANIALIKYYDSQNSYAYVIAPENIRIGDKIISSDYASITTGNTLLMQKIPLGTPIHNIEMKSNKGGQISRAAGSFATIINKNIKRIFLRLKSGEIRFVGANCRATVGVVSNSTHKNKIFKKAGEKSLLGFKSKVRGTAKKSCRSSSWGRRGQNFQRQTSCDKMGTMY
jgi:large subunit ribosomal protein L2